MADGINLVVLSGNCGADPVLKKFDDGGGILSIRMATSSSFVDRAGERKEITDWHNVAVKGGKRAEALSAFIKKGSKLTVTGRLSTRSYEKDGDKRYVTEVIADRIVLGGGNGAPKEDASFDPAKLDDPSTQGIENDDQP